MLNNKLRAPSLPLVKGVNCKLMKLQMPKQLPCTPQNVKPPVSFSDNSGPNNTHAHHDYDVIVDHSAPGLQHGGPDVMCHGLWEICK